ncbi:MAG: helix-turn-helix transcriptional regulator [Alphaproteobacteria bacterium]|nr:helix-turn-helix transcriptional regulator [Alphaproteobacteria bacterium]
MRWKELSRSERIELATEIANSMKKSGSLGERIRIVRFIYDMKQSEFADYLGVSRSYLSEVENEKGKPSIEMVVGIAHYFIYLNGNWLLTGDGDVHVPIRYDETGYSVLPVRNISVGILLRVIRAIEERLGEVWLCKQRGARRKAEILAYFYELVASAYGDAESEGNSRNLTGEDILRDAIDKIAQLGLPSVRHKPLEE